MNVLGIIVSLLVIVTWILVIMEYKKGNKDKLRTRLLLLMASILTLCMLFLRYYT